MDAQVSARLRHRHPAFPDKLDRLDLELSAELPSLHDHLRLDKTPNLGVHQTGSSSQRCWVHKTANVLAKLPKSQQPKAKRALQEIWMAETKAAAELAFDAFIESYTPKYAKAADCLSKDRDTLLAFYDFPAEHWKHLRTTNPIESTFATVRHRTI